MRKNINRVHVEGYLFQHSLEKKITGPDAKTPNTEYINGRIDIATDEAGLNVVPVFFTYVTAIYAKSGKKNDTFAVLDRIINATANEGNTTWVQVGHDALKVAVDGALEVNDFIGRDGTPVAQMRVSGSFCTVKSALVSEDKRNTFEIDTILTRATRIEADPERHIDQDFVRLNGAAFNFRNDLLPVTYDIENPKAMDYFEDILSGGDPFYAKAQGTIVNRTVQFDKTEETAWGDTVVVPVTRNERKWLVTTINSDSIYEFGDPDVITMDELSAAMQNREVHLADVKKRRDEYQANHNVTPAIAPATPVAAPSAPKPAATATGRKFNF